MKHIFDVYIHQLLYRNVKKFSVKEFKLKKKNQISQARPSAPNTFIRLLNDNKYPIASMKYHVIQTFGLAYYVRNAFNAEFERFGFTIIKSRSVILNC